MKSLVSLLITAAFLSAGCATPTVLVFPMVMGDNDPDPPAIKKSDRFEEVTLQQLQEGGIALGGAVIRDGTYVHRAPDLPPRDMHFGFPEQTDHWSANCEREFAENVSQLTCVPFFRFDDFVEDELLDSVWAEFARGGGISPALLDSVHDCCTAIRYLILVRVDYDDISHDINTSYILPPQYGSGLGKTTGSVHDAARVNDSLHPTIKRVVGLTVALYDLESMRCVWEAGVVKNVTRNVDPEALDDFSGIRAEQASSGQVTIVQAEEYPDAPTFGQVMDKCLDTIYTDMFQDMNRSTGDLNGEEISDDIEL